MLTAKNNGIGKIEGMVISAMNYNYAFRAKVAAWLPIREREVFLQHAVNFWFLSSYNLLTIKTKKLNCVGVYKLVENSVDLGLGILFPNSKN